MDYSGPSNFSGSQHGTIWDYAAGVSDIYNSTWALMTESADSLANYKAYNVNAVDDDKVEEVYGGRHETNTLSDMLIVEEEYGATLTIEGKITKSRQQRVMEVTQRIRRDRPDGMLAGQSGQLLRVYAAENGSMDGILLESMLGFQVAFLDTSNIFNGSDEPSVDIIQPGDDQIGNETPDQVHYRKENAGNKFAVCVKAGHNLIEVRKVASYSTKSTRQNYCLINPTNSSEPGLTYRNSKSDKDLDHGNVLPWGTTVEGVVEDGRWLKVGRGQYLPMKIGTAQVFKLRGELLLRVALDASGDMANIVDSTGQLVASMQTRMNDKREEMMLVQVGGGIDAALVLSALFAALKLG